MLGLQIKKYLNNNGISQTFLAHKVGIEINTLNAMLNGKRKILAEEYFKICTVLKVELDKFSPYSNQQGA